MSEDPSDVGLVRVFADHAADVVVARSVALRFARRCGLSEVRAQEVAIIAGELASNLVRHASKGVLELEWEHGTIVVRSLDRGSAGIEPDALLAQPGEVPCAVDERGAPRGGLGCGLGAVRRLSDELGARRREDGCLEITARRRA